MEGPPPLERVRSKSEELDDFIAHHDFSPEGKIALRSAGVDSLADLELLDEEALTEVKLPEETESVLVDLMKRGGFTPVPPPARAWSESDRETLDLKVRVQDLEGEVSFLKASLLKERQKTATLKASEESLKSTISTLESKQGVIIEAMKTTQAHLHHAKQDDRPQARRWARSTILDIGLAQ